MKVAVIGGGSSYTPELINGFLERVASFPMTELWIMDIQPERLEVVGGFAQRMVAAKGQPFAVHLTTNQREAIQGAAYVITQLRVGGMQARREDEYLGRRHGLIGQETTGVGGMAKALRTIPVVLNIARDITEVAPGALLANFTNPAGLVTEALSRYAPAVPAAGVCNVPITMKMRTLDTLAQQGLVVAPEQASLDTLGLNHLSWHRGFTIDGEDVWPRILEKTIAHLEAQPDPEWSPRLVASLGMIPNYYLSYFYETSRKLAAQEKWPPSRAEDVMRIEGELLAQYAEPDRTEPPPGLMQRGGAYYSTVATQLLNAHYNDLGEVHVVNVPHQGAVPGWPADWVLEMPCRVGRDGIRPLPARPLPPACFGLLAQVKMYELLTVEAAVHGDREAAYQALLAHPLGPPAHRVQAVLDDLLETHKAYLPQF
ncbi:MAG: 6-phospho-beta-glucosidase [Chloroflexi bacterium]|nr:6-phospho-beta-glucosidase [Chloroflexota bacterium]MCI0581236.1 6-phospho-beta-glucosidase [Chloroflexota bacterium]MCI0646913.1 6-phospho-beta-glucosidase [Chloroflexota bacterium]MCI0731642.1 6-phospho-beta-glucosidase [Chloroflexota bacterium]